MSTRPKGIDWDADFTAFPDDNDRERARRLGVCLSSVGRARRVRGLSPRSGSTPDDDDDDPPTLPSQRFVPAAASTEPAPTSCDVLDDELPRQFYADAYSIREFATPEQRRCLNSLITHGSIVDAAAALDMPAARLRSLYTEAQHRAARRGWSPAHDMRHATPHGFHVRGVSTYYDRHGNPSRQWVKINPDPFHREQLLLDALAEIAEPFRGALEPAPAPSATTEDLIAVYPMGDPHLGMYAWGEETLGSDFDLDIAERGLVAAVDYLAAAAPAADEGLIISCGDFFHTDNSTNRTNRSGHALDVDTRWAKLYRVGLRTMRRCIDQALRRHQRVRVICEIGNHDDHSSVMLATALSMLYEAESRVSIDSSPALFHRHRFGGCLIATTHGDKQKTKDLPGIMASTWPEEWGAAHTRVWYTGHRHHNECEEFAGCTVYTVPTLAPNDAHAAGCGYRSSRQMYVDTYHRTQGYCGRNVWIPELAA